MLVEDEALIRMGAASLLEEAGFAVIEARHADDAITVLSARSDVHLVMTDVDMPGSMDGLKLAHFIFNRWPPVKLVVVSGKPLAGVLPSGARFFSKPYGDEMLTRAITALLA